MIRERDSDSFRLYSVGEYGDIYSASRREIRCSATFQRATKDIYSTLLSWQKGTLWMRVGPVRLRMAISDFGDGYPTLDRRCELYSEKRQYGIFFADKATGAKQLNLQLTDNIHVSGGLGLAIPTVCYTAVCNTPQSNFSACIEAENSLSLVCAFATLEYEIKVLNQGRKTASILMEQSLDGQSGHRLLSMHGDMRDMDIEALLILSRLITLTGFPSDAKQIQVACGPCEK